MKRSYFIFLGLIALPFIVPMAPPFSSDMDEASTLGRTVPYEVGEWMGEDLELDEKTYEILETRNVVSRLYRNPEGKLIHLVIVGSDKNRRVAHPPEVCYLSSHFSVLDQATREFRVGGEGVSFREFVAQDPRNPKIKEKVLYTYKVGKRFTTNYFSQQLFFTWDRMTRQESQVLLIRLSGTGDPSFETFFQSLVPYLS